MARLILRYHFPFFIMTTSQDLAQQMKQADEQKRRTEELIRKQKDLLRSEVAQLDRDIAALQAQRSRANSDLSKLA